MRHRVRRIIPFILGLLLIACSSATPPATPVPASTPSVAAIDTPATPEPSATPAPSPTATEPPLTMWLDPGLEPAALEALAASGEAARAIMAQEPESASVRVAATGDAENALGTWLYVPVAPFPTLVDELSLSAIAAFWQGDGEELRALWGTETVPTLLVSSTTHTALNSLLGEASPEAPIETLDAQEILDRAWSARPLAWAIIPFEALEPRWKPLHLDGMNVLDKALDVAAYTLAIKISIEGQGADKVLGHVDPAVLTNRHTEKMTVLMMTGVTALVRATAAEMEQRGILYPATDIGPVLASADLTHISNEIPFAENCPYPDRGQESLVFCSAPKYIELLRAVGTDIVELTGNHFQDYGDEATLQTVEMYRQENWPYYGGGADLADATKPIIVDNNGNTLSFIGCNPVGPEYAWATEERPGAAPCNWDEMHSQLRSLSQQVDIPIATFQYWEFYQYEPTPQQQIDFRGMADAGAKIVSGSQAHHPQAIEFYNGAFIHYGLGNLFFDQMQSLGTRQEFIDRHVIYNGKHIATELLTYMLEDYCRPRPMTADEREQLLTSVFAASGW